MTKENGREVIHLCECAVCQRDPHGAVAEQHRMINRVVADTDERTRRLLAGLLARQQGRGGIMLLSQITGLSRVTIRRGQHELQAPDETPRGRVRRRGGGRRPVEKNAPKS